MRKMIRASLLAIAALSVNAVADELNPQPPRETAKRYTIDSARTVVSFGRRRIRATTTSRRTGIRPSSGNGKHFPRHLRSCYPRLARLLHAEGR
jgi:hypothetical protein